MWIFCILPYLTSQPFNQNTAAQLWYFIKCVYFGLSAWQIKSGYSLGVLGKTGFRLYLFTCTMSVHIDIQYSSHIRFYSLNRDLTFIFVYTCIVLVLIFIIFHFSIKTWFDNTETSCLYSTQHKYCHCPQISANQLGNLI